MNSSSRHPITLKQIVYSVPDMESVRVRRDVEYHRTSAGPLSMDIYLPDPASADRDGRGMPAVLVTGGYPDVGVPRLLGCTFKEMGVSISLAQAIAASGMAAAVYTTASPASDAVAAFDFLAGGRRELGIDGSRLGLWSMSGNVPVAVSVLIERGAAVRAAVLSQGYTFGFGGTAVADAARAYGFADATADRTIDQLPAEVPLFVARAGRDEIPGLNGTLDRFIAAAISRNLPVTVVNHPTSPHSFEVNHDTPTSRRLIADMLGFMAFHLGR